MVDKIVEPTWSSQSRPLPSGRITQVLAAISEMRVTTKNQKSSVFCLMTPRHQYIHGELLYLLPEGSRMSSGGWQRARGTQGLPSTQPAFASLLLTYRPWVFLKSECPATLGGGRGESREALSCASLFICLLINLLAIFIY